MFRMRTLTAVVVAGAGFLGVSAGPRALAQGDSVTFAEHVAPIVFTKCASCHRPGEAAPFQLLRYEDVRSRGRLIAAAVGKRRMPPWKAGPSDYAFKNDRRLGDAEIDTVKKWVDAGMPEGDRARTPALPVFTEGWQLGAPDLVVSMRQPFRVPADGPDVYRNFVVPLGLTEDRWVNAIDFRPSARAVVHHSLFFLDSSGNAREEDALDLEPGFSGTMGGVRGLGGRGRGRGRGAGAALLGLVGGLGGGQAIAGAPGDADLSDAVRTAGGLGGWALGGQARALPKGLAFFVPKGADLILSTHFHPSGKIEQEASTVGLYFADTPPTQSFTGVQLPPLFGVFEGLDIPAGSSGYTISDTFELPVEVKAFGVGAHAHYLAKEMKLTATLPSGETKTLIWINDWDFTWQEQYPFNELVTLPKGTRLSATLTYDNSPDNPRNPTKPPVRVVWGEQSGDEMGSVGLQVVAAREEDMPTLRQAYGQHVRQAALTRPGLRQLLQRFQGGRGRR
jgi:hypothetical protein